MEKQKIYIIEDNSEMADLISMYIESAGMEHKSFFTAEQAINEVRTRGLPDLFILDLHLPKMSGFEFLKIIRRENSSTIPVIIVSTDDTDDDVVKGLELGADAFLKKPFSPKILIAQINASFRRFAIYSKEATKSVRFDDYVLMFDSNVLKKGAKKVPLSQKEYAVLEYLVRNVGISVSPEKIYKEVWGTPFGETTAIAVYIQHLRKKIEKDPLNPVYIKTDFGNGYIFEKSVLQ